ncbi:restriction endonuclease subunit S [Pseudomonas fluorescens]|uniref:restriction endonuclease subunit S n=1 Tax=Pseudomonas fluorescens TaxID=294 RepID=UPI001242E9C7|nr:restriction endonuclease subunit S [Pseudomonas fluorescens]VVO77177.1 hypothetical protein PS898_01616 [Pseudomonas fluorescens]
MSLPSPWREVNLLEVCEVNPRPSPADGLLPETAVSMLPHARVDQLTDLLLNYDVRPFSQTPGKAGLFRNNDVLVATRGPHAMKSALVQRLPTDVGVAQHFLVLRAGSELMPEYLLHFVQQPWFQLAARDMNRGTGHQLTIPTQFFRDLRLPLPPLQEQRILIELFRNASLAPYRTAVARARQLLDVLAQELLVSGHHAGSWPRHTLSKVCAFNPARLRPWESTPQSRVNYYSQAGVDWLTHEVEPERTTVEDLSHSCGEVHAGDVLFSFGPNALSRSTVCVVPSDDSVRHFASTAFQVLRPTGAILPQYLACFMRLPWLGDQVRTISRTQGRLPRALFDRIELTLPPIHRQREIVESLSKVPTLRLRDALETAELLAQAMYREGFSGQLSRQWRESYAEVSALTASVQERLPATELAPQERFTPALRTARNSVSSQLSSVQARVWELLCDQRHPLVIDDPDAVAAFCLALQADVSVAPVALRRALQQLAALGLIRQMSIPGAQGTFMTAFRRCRVTELGRAAEDTAIRDAQLFRDNIADPEWGL